MSIDERGYSWRVADTSGEVSQGGRVRAIGWRLVHWAIIANLAAEFAYAG